MYTYKIEDSKHYEGPRGIMQFMRYHHRDTFFIVMDHKGRDIAVSRHQMWAQRYCDRKNKNEVA